MEQLEGLFRDITSKFKSIGQREVVATEALEETVNVYALPFPKGTKVEGIVKEGPEHNGPYRGAVDYLVEIGTPVLAPLGGTVARVVDINDRYGPGKKFRNCLNYITLRHEQGTRVEYSEVAHLARGSARVKVGDTVTEGDILAVTGKSGRMTEPHLHVLIFKGTEGNPYFQGLEPRFKEEVIVSK